MDFKDFEGYKKIPNTKNIELKKIYEILDQYRENIGGLSYNEDIEEILVSIHGKYDAKIYLKNEEIIIERILEEGHLEDNQNYFETGKSIPLAHADRIIEQIYDLLNDYIDDGVIKEHITTAKKILKLIEDPETKALRNLFLADSFVVTDYNNEQKKLYTIKQNVLSKSYIVNNLETRREAFSLKYERRETTKFTISKQPFEIIDIKKDKDSVKSVFRGKIKTKELKISADYSDNHYIVELDEIVIGAVDCLDSMLKRNYRLEINDLKYEDIIIAVAIIADYISVVEKKGA